MPKWSRTIRAPEAGAFPDALNRRAIPPNGATSLINMILGPGFVRARDGRSLLTTTAPAELAVDIHNIAFGTGVVETLFHSEDKTYRFQSSDSTWPQITGPAWTGGAEHRFWSVLTAFGGSATGDILFNNGVDAIEHWDGTTATSLGANAMPARYAVVGEDARLITAGTLEGGNRHAQRVRWTTIALPSGDHDDWTNTGSGALDLRNDPHPITALFKLNRQIFVGKSRSIATLISTGLPTNAFGYAPIIGGEKDGSDGVWAPASVLQYGGLVGYISPRTIVLFNGSNTTDILSGRARNTLYRRLNVAALSRITSIVDADNNRIGWGLPLDGNEYPSEIWWYDLERGAWVMDRISHRAMVLFTNTDTTSVDELTGTVNALTGTVDGLSVQADARGSITFAHEDATLTKFDPAAEDDVGAAIASEYITPALALEGGIDVGTERGPGPFEKLILDEVSSWFQDYGNDYTIKVEASSDNGRSWTLLGNILVESGLGSLTEPGIQDERIQGRIDMGRQCLIRMTNVTVGARWGFAETTVTFDVLGAAKRLVLQTGLPAPGPGASGSGGNPPSGGGSSGGGGGGRTIL